MAAPIPARTPCPSGASPIQRRPMAAARPALRLDGPSALSAPPPARAPRAGSASPAAPARAVGRETVAPARSPRATPTAGRWQPPPAASGRPHRPGLLDALDQPVGFARHRRLSIGELGEKRVGLSLAV